MRSLRKGRRKRHRSQYSKLAGKERGAAAFLISVGWRVPYCIGLVSFKDLKKELCIYGEI